MRNFSKLLFAAACFGFSWNALAHGDLHEQIEQVSRELLFQPHNAKLFYKRATLYRQHQEWSRALADLKKAKGEMPREVLYLEGVVLRESGQAANAKQVLDDLLEQYPDHGEALVARARTQVELKQYAAAAADYEAAAKLINTPDPDFYLERARCLREADERTSALQMLDESMGMIGVLPGLQAYAIELEKELGNYTAALDRLKTLRKIGGRQIKWNALEGEILLKAGRKAEARRALESTLEELEAIPAGQQKHWEMLKQQVLRQLEEFRSSTTHVPETP